MPLRRVAGVTFTNAAAAELRARVGAGVRAARSSGRFLELTFDDAVTPLLEAAERELGGATLSTTIGGFATDHLGTRIAFLCLAMAAGLGALLVLLVLPETGQASSGQPRMTPSPAE